MARVPGYSPEAVAEHAMALALTANRHTHKAYIKCRENNFALNGLMGVNFYQKTAGIIGTGKIGQAMAKICRGFGMKVIAYDLFPNKNLDFLEYVSLNELLATSDLISLHCPMTPETEHLINSETIAKMKDGVILVNTSRGGLIKTDDLIAGIREPKSLPLVWMFTKKNLLMYMKICPAAFFLLPRSSVFCPSRMLP